MTPNKSDKSTKDNSRCVVLKQMQDITALLNKLGYSVENDGKLSRNQYRNCDIKKVALDISNNLLMDRDSDKIPFYDLPTIQGTINRLVADKVKESEDNLYIALKHDEDVVIDDAKLKSYLSLYFQWETETDYAYYKDIFIHWLLSVKRRFYHKVENKPLCIIFNGGAGDGKSIFLRDICGLMDNASLDVKHFDELFNDNRGFEIWENYFILAIHEMGIIPEKSREKFKDIIDARYGAGRKMGRNNFTKTDAVASLIGATNLSPKEILAYEPNNRKIVFLPFIRITPANADAINDQRDSFRRDNFLMQLFKSINEDSKDNFDDDNYYERFKLWLKPRNAEHTITEKYHDCLIKLYAGQKIKAGTWYHAYIKFHERLAKFNDEGKKSSPMASNKFSESFKYIYDYKRTNEARYYLVPTIQDAYNRGYCYVEPTDDLLAEPIIDLLKDNVAVIDDSDLIKETLFQDKE